MMSSHGQRLDPHLNGFLRDVLVHSGSCVLVQTLEKNLKKVKAANQAAELYFAWSFKKDIFLFQDLDLQQHSILSNAWGEHKNLHILIFQRCIKRLGGVKRTGQQRLNEDGWRGSAFTFFCPMPLRIAGPHGCSAAQVINRPFNAPGHFLRMAN